MRAGVPAGSAPAFTLGLQAAVAGQGRRELDFLWPDHEAIVSLIVLCRRAGRELVDAANDIAARVFASGVVRPAHLAAPGGPHLGSVVAHRRRHADQNVPAQGLERLADTRSALGAHCEVGNPAEARGLLVLAPVDQGSLAPERRVPVRNRVRLVRNEYEGHGAAGG